MAVAANFEKRHADVIRTIEEKLTNAKLRSLKEEPLNAKLRSVNWFIESNYKDASGKSNKEHLITEEGAVR